MNTPHALSSPAEFFRLLRAQPRRLLVPAVVVAAVAGVYALVKHDTWEASQAVIVRNEASGNLEGPGKFSRPEELKLTQETILEIGKSPGVLAAALAEVGPPANYRDPAAWPTAKDVADLATSVRFTPPKGAELGATEVFYVKVKDRDRLRAANLATAVCNQLQARFQKLRDQRAQSMADELTKTVAMAQSDLEASTSKLTKMEREVGPDLAELRNLQEQSSGDSDLRRKAVEIENELRQAKVSETNNRELLKLLTAARDNPGTLLATPNRLLDSQPALKRLKDGLVDAQLRTAQQLGTMTHEHPLVGAARANEQAIAQELHQELQSAVASLEVDVRMTTGQVVTLEQQLNAIKGRLERLVAVRAEYSNLASETKHKALLLEAAQRDLASARSSQASSQAASQITRIDTPNTGTQPVGPSRAMIVLAGLAGGLLTGLGVVFLGLPLPPTPQAAKPQADKPRSEKVNAAAPNDSFENSFEPAMEWTPELDVEEAAQSDHHPVAAYSRHAAPQSLSFSQALEKSQTRNGNGQR